MNNILDQNLMLKGKKVLLRVDLNVPIRNGAITESSRIEKIDELNQETDTLLEEIDKWQM